MLGAGVASVDARPLPAQADELPGALEPGVTDVGVGAAASISGDGRYVVRQGPAEGAAADAPSTIWLTDLASGSQTDLVVAPPNVRPGRSIQPVISGDGCSVVFHTEVALDLFRDDDSAARWDLYRLVLPHCGGAPGDWELVSTQGAAPVSARNDVIVEDPVSLSWGGEVLAYTHPADHLAAEGLRAVSVVDFTVPVDAPGRSVLAAGLPTSAPDTVYTHLGQDQPALSGDGRFLAFRSDAASADPVARWGAGPVEGAPATRQIFVWDREQPDRFGAIVLASSSFDGEGTVSGAARPVLSRDGRILVFESEDVGIVGLPRESCGERCATQVFRLDRDVDADGAFDESGAVELVLVSSEQGSETPVPGSGPSFAAALSGDGQAVAFVTKAANLRPSGAAVGGDSPEGELLRWRDGALSPVVPPAALASRPGTHAGPDLDDTGRTAVYDSTGLGGARSARAMFSPPRLTLADLDVGTTLVGQTSDEWFLSVVNEGPASFRPFQVTVSDDQFAVNEEQSSCLPGVTVEPGDQCVVRLSFTPSGPGPVSATLRVTEVGFGSAAVEATVSGAGGQPSLRIDPGGVDLGTIDVGSSADVFFLDVQNTSLLSTRLASVQVAGANPADFTVTEENCLGRPFNPRAACSIGVVFAPTDQGRRTALIEVRSEDGAYTTTLISGDGRYAPELIAAQTVVAAGESAAFGGVGFPADAEIVFRFSGEPTVLGRGATNSDGAFLTDVVIPVTTAGGPRVMVAEAVDGVSGATTVDVVARFDVWIGLPGFGLG